MVYQNADYSIVKEMIEKLKSIVNDNKEVQANFGISEILSGYNSISELYNQSQNALDGAKILNEFSIKYSEMGVYKLLFDVKKKELLKDYCIENLGEIIRYDKENNSDLCKTLRCYCENNGSINDMAEIFSVHRNTINYKMKKIKDILGIELSNKNIMDIMLSFIISDMIN